MHSLVSTDWLADRLSSPHVAILDASSHLPMARRDAYTEFAMAHVPGAKFLDFASLTDRANLAPTALPTARQVAERLSGLGVRRKQRIVVYDDSAVRTAARAWFALRMAGLEQVAILDGGLGKWRTEGRTIETGAPPELSDLSPSSTPEPEQPPPPFQTRTKADLLADLDAQTDQVLDARDEARFTGEAADFRANVAPGHIPGSRNLPFDQVLREDGTYRAPSEIRTAFAEAGIDWSRPVVTTCGSGVTASVLLFAMHLAGKDDGALYDGSWSEWGADPATPKALGPA